MRKIIVVLIIFLLCGCAGGAGAPGAAASQPQAAMLTPLAWDSHGLSGKMLLIRYLPDSNELVELDLPSGKTTSLFKTPANGRLSAAARSPDGEQLVLAYGPPPKNGATQFGYTELYLLPYGVQAGQPKAFLQRKQKNESFFNPTWALDGQTIYYSHFFEDPKSSTHEYKYTLEKTDLKGNSQLVLDQATWPVLSPDGARLAYLSANPASTTNDLYLMNIDGSQQAPITSAASGQAVDAHSFSRDGKALYFSMVNAQPKPTSTVWDRLMGVEVVSAHNAPSDWYRVGLTGGQAQRLTNLNETGMNGGFSPDGKYFAFIALDGLFVLKLDDLSVNQLANDIYVGTLDWIQN